MAPSVGDAPRRVTYTEKELRTAQAQAALRGVVLQPVELDGGACMLIVSRRGVARTFGSLGEATAFVDVLAGGGK
jgi:hypothetical protein